MVQESQALLTNLQATSVQRGSRVKRSGTCSYLMVNDLFDACLDEQFGTLIARKQRHIDTLQQSSVHDHMWMSAVLLELCFQV